LRITGFSNRVLKKEPQQMVGTAANSGLMQRFNRTVRFDALGSHLIMVFAPLTPPQSVSAYRIALNRMLNQVHQPKSKHAYPDRSDNGC
jgi:hypothetical protein